MITTSTKHLLPPEHEAKLLTFIMNDQIEIKEELDNISMLVRVEETLQKVEDILVKHGHAEDTCATKIAEVLGVSDRLSEREEVSPSTEV